MRPASNCRGLRPGPCCHPRWGGPRDPLKGWTRMDAALTDTLSIEQATVDVTAFGLQLVEMDQATVAAQMVTGVNRLYRVSWGVVAWF